MLKIGKISPEILEKLVLQPATHTKIKRKDVILRPKTGEDCSVIDSKGELCVLSTDPITGATKDIGYLAVQINCNDVYSAGAEPIGILLTILLPAHSQEETLQEIMDGAIEATTELGIEILGGHTEVTEAVNQPIISATIIGKTKNKKIVCTGGAQIGQDVIMTKWAGLEGTAILAKEYEDVLSKKINSDLLQEAHDMKKFLSVKTESQIATDYGATAMHDVTEGGIFGAVWELADCSNVGIDIFEEKIPVKEVTKEICTEAGISPFHLISSGSLIIAAFNGQKLVEKLKEAGIEAAMIGKITKQGKYIYDQGIKKELEQPTSDALFHVKMKENE